MSELTANELLVRSGCPAALQAGLEIGLDPSSVEVSDVLPIDVESFAEKGARYAAIAAERTDAPEYLSKVARKDRRISVLKAVAANPRAPQEAILDVYRRAWSDDHTGLLVAAVKALDAPTLATALKEATPKYSSRHFVSRHFVSRELGRRMLAGEQDVAVVCAGLDHDDAWKFHNPFGQFFDYGNFPVDFGATPVDPSILSRLKGVIDDKFIHALFFGILRIRQECDPLDDDAFNAGLEASEGAHGRQTINVLPSGAVLSHGQASALLATGDRDLMYIAVDSTAMSEKLFVSHSTTILGLIHESGRKVAWRGWEWTPAMVAEVAGVGRDPLGEHTSFSRFVGRFVLDLINWVDQSMSRYELVASLSQGDLQYLSDILPLRTGTVVPHLISLWAQRKTASGQNLDYVLDGLRDHRCRAAAASGFVSGAAVRPECPVAQAGLLKLYGEHRDLLESGADREIVNGAYAKSRLGDNVAAWKMLHSILKGEAVPLEQACDVALELTS